MVLVNHSITFNRLQIHVALHSITWTKQCIIARFSSPAPRKLAFEDRKKISQLQTLSNSTTRWLVLTFLSGKIIFKLIVKHLPSGFGNINFVFLVIQGPIHLYYINSRGQANTFVTFTGMPFMCANDIAKFTRHAGSFKFTGLGQNLYLGQFVGFTRAEQKTIAISTKSITL